MARVTDSDVREIMDRDLANVDSIPSMIPFITAASLLIDRVKKGAITKGIPLTTSELREIERWFAAHLAVHKAPQFNSKSTQGASGSFKTLDYLETAKLLDPSGVLTTILENKQASADWLGKPPTQQIPYSQRR